MRVLYLHLNVIAQGSLEKCNSFPVYMLLWRVEIVCGKIEVINIFFNLYPWFISNGVVSWSIGMINNRTMFVVKTIGLKIRPRVTNGTQ